MNHEGAKDAKDLFLYLIGETDQVNHHSLRQYSFLFHTKKILRSLTPYKVCIKLVIGRL